MSTYPWSNFQNSQDPPEHIPPADLSLQIHLETDFHHHTETTIKTKCKNSKFMRKKKKKILNRR